MSKNIDLKGIIDIHIHTAPDVVPRVYDDFEICERAYQLGASGVMLKSHHFCTAARAKLANKLYEGKVHAFGGLALNVWTGGLNIHAVEAALKMGVDIIWLPTISSILDHKAFGKPGGIEVVRNHKAVPELDDIFKLMAETNQAALGTGHCSAEDALIVVDRARELGIERIIVNHPALYRMNYSIEDQQKLLPYNVYFERCYGATERPKSTRYVSSVPQNIRDIKALGVESTIIASDLGSAAAGEWGDCMTEYLNQLYENGFSEEEIQLMTRTNPARAMNYQIRNSAD